MGRKKKVATAAPSQPVEQAKPHRAGVSKQFWLNAQLAKALDDYFDSQGDLPPSQTKVFTAAIKMFLEKEGFWPPKRDS